MAIEAVIFDWGGTLTPWHTIDFAEFWQTICAQHFPDDHADRAAALYDAERELWLAAETDQRSGTMSGMFERARVAPTDDLLATYFTAWEPHTFTDPEVPALFTGLRQRGIKIGVLSNTLWPRSWHERIFRRDDVLHLIDGAVYSSEIDRTKPHREAFAAAMAAVGATDSGACVFVGDRPWDDIHGAQQAGMRAVLLPHEGVPPFPEAIPDAVIGRLSELTGLIESW